MQQNEKICILFDAHAEDEISLTNFASLSQSSYGICDIYVVCNKTNGKQFKTENIIALTDGEIFNTVSHSKDISHGIIPGNWDLKLVRAFERLNSYDRYIRWEFDVVCASATRDVISSIVSRTKGIDFAASYIDRYKENGWKWWDSLAVPKLNADSPKQIAVGAFLPLAVFSRRMLKIYRQCLIGGWTGHGEVTIPSVAAYFELRTLDLNKTNPPMTSWRFFNLKTPVSMEGFQGDLIHPVKNIATAKALNDFAPKPGLGSGPINEFAGAGVL